jgi:hypothetical protein
MRQYSLIQVLIFVCTIPLNVRRITDIDSYRYRHRNGKMRLTMPLWGFGCLLVLCLLPIIYYSTLLPVMGGELESECLTDPASKVDLRFTEFIAEHLRNHYKHHWKKEYKRHRLYHRHDRPTWSMDIGRKIWKSKHFFWGKLKWSMMLT